MQTNTLYSKWSQLAGLLLIGGSLAWAIKLAVIISTDGRIITTGTAALMMQVGLLLLLVGSTGIGTRLSLHRRLWLRIVAIVLSPALFFGSCLLFGLVSNPLFSNSGVWYAQQEAPVGFAVVVYFAVGYFLYRSQASARQVV